MAAHELPVPETVSAFYAVPTTDSSVTTESLVAAGLGRVETALPRQLPQPLVQVHLAADLPPLPIDQLAASGATDEQLTRLLDATHLVLVSLGGRPGWPPAHEWIARSLAAGIAQRLGADVIDLLATQVLDLPTVSASLPDAAGLVCLADWVAVEVWPERDGYSCTTSGLRRFGLPELQTTATPAGVVDAWGRAMVGLAWRLLGAWRDALAPHGDSLPATVPLPTAITVTDTDVIEAHTRVTEAGGPRPGRPSYAAAGAAPAAATVRLVPHGTAEPDRPGSFLAIQPPGGRSVPEFLAEACEVLFGQSALAPRPVADPEFERAIAAARAELPAIRERYAAGGFAPVGAEVDGGIAATWAGPNGARAPRQRLLVRYALAADEAVEYAWAYVTSWRDPFRILATSATDSVHLPRLRAGRPVVLDAAAVVDWAVELDGIGIVEGAYTRSAG